MKTYFIFLVLCIFQTIAFSQNEYLADKTNPYSVFSNNMDIYGSENGNRNFTVFRHTDINFSSTRFATYLQTTAGLADKPGIDGKGFRIDKYVPKVNSSSNVKYLNVRYNYKKRSDILGYYQTEDSTYDIIDNVEIIGTTSLVIDLFVRYWPMKIDFDGFKIGEIASKQFLADKVTLYGVNKGVCKILIQKGNLEVDYHKTFGINAPKK